MTLKSYIQMYLLSGRNLAVRVINKLLFLKEVKMEYCSKTGCTVFILNVEWVQLCYFLCLTRKLL